MDVDSEGKRIVVPIDQNRFEPTLKYIANYSILRSEPIGVRGI